MDQIKTKTTIQNLWDTVKADPEGSLQQCKLISVNNKNLEQPNFTPKGTKKK